VRLIACRDCDNPVSPDAKACPHCGWPVRKHRPPSVARSFVAIFLSPLTLAGFVLGYYGVVPWWLVAPLWALWMAAAQWGMHVERREWRRPWANHSESDAVTDEDSAAIQSEEVTQDSDA
jgi:hypothetical protein